MRKRALLFIATGFYLLLAITACNKHDSTGTSAGKKGTARGSISNEYNQLLTGVAITLQGDNLNNAVNSPDGHYIFGDLPAGAYHLSVKKDGYLETSIAIQVKTADTLTTDIVLKAGTAYFNLLSDTIITFPPAGNDFTIRVASNTAWVISNPPDWIVPAKLTSNGNDTFEVKVLLSSVDTLRQAELILQAGSLQRKIRVVQTPKIFLRNVVVIPGNRAKGAVDSVALLFNQPVTIRSVVPATNFCQSDFKYAYSPDNKVTFSYACGSIGGEYGLTINAVNALGEQFTKDITVGFYDKVIKLTGTIQNYFVNDADNSYWVITDHPNALYKIDMQRFEIVHTYNLPALPVCFTVSPYNNKIYLAYSQIPKLFVLNQNGETDQVIDIIEDTARKLQQIYGPRIYPIRIAFTKNGKGLVWIADRSLYGSSYFWYIDAAAGHRIFYQPLPGESPVYFDAKANYDKSKLIMTFDGNGDPAIKIFDGALMKYTSYTPTKRTRGSFITPNRKNASIYSGQLYNQLIVNPETGFESLESYNDNRNNGNVDFSYQPGRDLNLYFTQDGLVELLDYSKGYTPVSYTAINRLNGTTATLDGKYVILNYDDGNYNAKIIRLPGAWFDY